MRKLLLILGIAFINNIQAADLTITNTFTAGTPAVAAEVNANFTAVDGAVDGKLVLGPRIQIKKPSIQDIAGGDTIVTPTLMDLLVEFVETGAPVDMESLEVKVIKGWFSKSLTDRLKPYVKGTTIEANDLEVPEGRYLIEFYVADSNGAETTATYGLKVVRQ